MINQYKKKYHNHSASADQRGVPFNLTFEEWMDIWVSSGHLEDRGVTGYVMARFNDQGGYEVGNVEIQHHTKNISEASRRSCVGLWSYDDIDTAIVMFKKKYSIKHIAQHLKRTENAVNNKLRKNMSTSDYQSASRG